MTISDRPSAKAWLQQFDQDDLPLATLLLESLEFVSHRDYFDGLRTLIASEAASAELPIALFCVREIGDDEKYFPDDNGQKPTIVDAPEDVGSEGTAANLVTQMCRADPDRYLNHPSINEQRTRTIRKALLIDDTVGTGTRLKRFCVAFYRHKTIKSWISKGWLRLKAAIYCASEKGIRLATEKSPFALEVVRQRRSQARSEFWDEAFRRDVERLCRKYSKRAGIEKHILGVGGVLGVLVFEHGCTNLLPAILWHTNDKWNALFPQRTIPDDLRIAFDIEPDIENIRGLLRAVGHTRYRRMDCRSHASRSGCDPRPRCCSEAASRRIANRLLRWH